MSRSKCYLFHVTIAVWVTLVGAILVGYAPTSNTERMATILGAILAGLYSAALGDGIRLPRLVWQSPRLFKNSGLFLKCGDRRWRLVRVGGPK